MDDEVWVLEEDRILVVVEDERTIWVPGEIRVVEVEADGSTG
jgi:hypothetical protein